MLLTSAQRTVKCAEMMVDTDHTVASDRAQDIGDLSGCVVWGCIDGQGVVALAAARAVRGIMLAPKGSALVVVHAGGMCVADGGNTCPNVFTASGVMAARIAVNVDDSTSARKAADDTDGKLFG
jgi:hypothetical protein